MRAACTAFLLSILLTSSAGAVPFVVLGDQQWQDTGFDVTAGQLLSIEASGLINFKPGFTSAAPDGWPDGTNPNFSADSLLPSANVLSLVGIIDPTGGTLDDAIALPEGQPGFGLGFVGSSYSQVVPISGRLYLAFNDSYFPDNVGNFDTIITPEPSTAVLVLVGIAGLAGWRRRPRAD